MEKQNIVIDNIPAILWGSKSDKLFVAVHGDKSNKADDIMVLFAEEVAGKDGQVLSFDLPEHGDRKNSPEPCKVQNCVDDLSTIMRYAHGLSDNINLFAVSMGAYFSLLTYKNEPLKQAIFLSPVVSMKRIIENMMKWFSVSEDRLKAEKEIPTPIGKTLYWDYYQYVKENPIVKWNNPTSILYGRNDNLSEFDVVSAFVQQYHCDLTVMDNGEHFFHTDEQLEFFRNWLRNTL